MRRAWAFYDIRILSSIPFWVARVELAPFARQLGNLQIFIFGPVWCARVTITRR